MGTEDPFVCPCCGIDAAKLRLLADWIEAIRPGRGTEVQDDLREWAEGVEAEARG